MNVLLRSAVPALLGLVLGIGFVPTATKAEVAVIIGERPMPAARVEVVPAPRVGYAWVRGHWVWRAGWVWVPGHYVRGEVPPMPAEIVEVVPARPSPAHVWIKGHHVWEGGRWVWHTGVWVRG
jgi:hypothetical protein